MNTYNPVKALSIVRSVYIAFSIVRLHRPERKMRQNYLKKIKLSVISFSLFDKMTYQIGGYFVIF